MLEDKSKIGTDGSLVHYFLQQGQKKSGEKRRDVSLMLATIHNMKFAQPAVHFTK